MAPVGPLPSERKALLFSAGGVRFGVRLSLVREIVPAPEGGEVVWRGEPIPTAFVSTVLGLPAGPSPYALLTEGTPRAALRVEALHGIVDVAGAEYFQLPARTPQPQPSPFSGAIVVRGEVALELAVGALGFAPLEPAVEGPVATADLGPSTGQELLFARGHQVYAVPLSLAVQVLVEPRVAPVPLAPPSHVGLLYHGRSLHPVLDMAVLYGEGPQRPGRAVLVLDAGGAGVGVVADGVLGVETGLPDVVRPPWDAICAA